MQSKVSMVVPCYNKIDYIGEMLESVLAQQWNNIELLLVNDGSTDGTRDVIVSFLPRIKERGFEVKLIDQENGGCCSAVYTGLINMTGDYFCLVDADDRIQPQYVSKMAGWLDGHSDYEWAACSHRPCIEYNGVTTVGAVEKCVFPQDTDNLLEKWILRQTVTTVWIYMTRVSYVKKCKMIENWNTARNKTYEPLIGIPLMNGAGKLKFFHEGLYLYVQTSRDLFKFNQYTDITGYYDDYRAQYKWSIARLDADDGRKTRLTQLVDIAYVREVQAQLPCIKDSADHYIRLNIELLNVLNRFSSNIALSLGLICKLGFMAVYNIVCAGIVGSPYSRYKRIIGYGVLGKYGRELLPYYMGTAFEPDVLWDKDGDGIEVLKPDFDSLSEEDLVIIFPKKYIFVKEILKLLGNTRAEVVYLEGEAILRDLLLLPGFCLRELS